MGESFARPPPRVRLAECAQKRGYRLFVGKDYKGYATTKSKACELKRVLARAAADPGEELSSCPRVSRAIVRFKHVIACQYGSGKVVCRAQVRDPGRKERKLYGVFPAPGRRNQGSGGLPPELKET